MPTRNERKEGDHSLKVEENILQHSFHNIQQCWLLALDLTQISPRQATLVGSRRSYPVPTWVELSVRMALDEISSCLAKALVIMQSAISCLTVKNEKWRTLISKAITGTITPSSRSEDHLWSFHCHRCLLFVEVQPTCQPPTPLFPFMLSSVKLRERPPVSLSSFKRIWKTYHPEVKRIVPTEDACARCKDLRRKTLVELSEEAHLNMIQLLYQLTVLEPAGPSVDQRKLS